MGLINDAPSLVVGQAAGEHVLHLVLRVPPARGAAALALLRTLPVAFGVPTPGTPNMVSVGMSHDGLRALGLPERYLRVFHRLAPAFKEGARRQSQRIGDAGPNALANWAAIFRDAEPHLLISWHGHAPWLRSSWRSFYRQWLRQVDPAPARAAFKGARLGAPPNQTGQWVHFGYRDGLSEIVIPGMQSTALDPRPHAAGALLLGEPDDMGANRFALPRASDKARRFFHGSSFGVFRPIRQDVAAFEQQVGAWSQQLSWLGPPGGVTHDFIKAKLCGRWPDGRTVAPGDLVPAGANFVLDAALQNDRAGEGCPFGAHARRMRPELRSDGLTLPRPLQRRSIPCGPATWAAQPAPADAKRGLLGHFFCASIETQFEHLIGQWAERPPLGLPPDDDARDPLIGGHADPGAALQVPLRGKAMQALRGMRDWTHALGMMYLWHPGRHAWHAMLDQDYVRPEDEGPWL
jgi:hypothetical protein